MTKIKHLAGGGIHESVFISIEEGIQTIHSIQITSLICYIYNTE